MSNILMILRRKTEICFCELHGEGLRRLSNHGKNSTMYEDVPDLVRDYITDTAKHGTYRQGRIAALVQL